MLQLGGDERARLLAAVRPPPPAAPVPALPAAAPGAPPPAPPLPAWSALPVPLTSFIGRAAELALLAHNLADPACRLLTLVGAGGSGKTRLAIEAARRQQARFADGVVFVALAPLAAPALLVPTIAEAVGLTLQAEEDPRRQLLRFLRPQERLLVLDNLEQLLEGVELLGAMLQAAPGVRILATSRARLNLAAEWVVELEGLTLPVGEQLEQVAASSAVQLFVQRAGRLRGGFALGAENAGPVAAICRLVAGMPLGLELAAGWVRALACAEIAEALAGNLPALHTTLRDVPARHRSLGAVLDHSWRLLTAEEQRVLRRLAVFRGGFTRAAAAAVVGDEEPPGAFRFAGQAALFGTLAALVDQSLLRWDGAARYDLHELVRQYAAERLQEDQYEAAQAQDRHCRYYGALLQHWEEQLVRGQQPDVAPISQEIANIRAGWRRAVEHARWVELGQYQGGLWELYLWRGWFQEGVETFTEAAEYLRAHASVEACAAIPADRVLGQLLAIQGAFCVPDGRFRQAQEILPRSLTLLRRADAPRETAFALTYLGAASVFRGAFADAKVPLQEAIALCRPLGALFRMAEALGHLGFAAQYLGEYAEARRLLNEGLAAGEASGNRRWKGLTLNGLGFVQYALGTYDEAQRHLETSLVLSQELGYPTGELMAARFLALVAAARGEWEAAIQWCQHSVAICREIGYRAYLVISLTDLARILALSGRFGEARQCGQESLALVQSLGAGPRAAAVHNALGLAACGLGEDAEARRWFAAALHGAQAAANTPLALEVLVGLAALLAGEQQGERAAELLALVIAHPASEQFARDRAGRLLAELAAALPAPALAAARARGQAQALEHMVEELLRVI